MHVRERPGYQDQVARRVPTAWRQLFFLPLLPTPVKLFKGFPDILICANHEASEVALPPECGTQSTLFAFTCVDSSGAAHPFVPGRARPSVFARDTRWEKRQNWEQRHACSAIRFGQKVEDQPLHD